MGMVVVISLPFIIFSILLGSGCYFLGRHRGKRETRSQVFGTPTPPPGALQSSPAPAHTKPAPPPEKYSSIV